MAVCGRILEKWATSSGATGLSGFRDALEADTWAHRRAERVIRRGNVRVESMSQSGTGRAEGRDPTR